MLAINIGCDIYLPGADSVPGRVQMSGDAKQKSSLRRWPCSRDVYILPFDALFLPVLSDPLRVDSRRSVPRSRPIQGERRFTSSTMERKEGLRTLPVRDNHNCFGCSTTNASGLKMRFQTDGEALYTWLVVPDHFSGWSNLVHGGITTTILDETMGWSAIYLLRAMVLTKSINIDFLKPIYVGDDIRAEGRVVEMREREAVMQGLLYNSEGRLCARATGIFAMVPAERAKKMGMLDEALLRDLDKLVSPG